MTYVDCTGTILSSPLSPLSGTQIACNESFIALPSSGNEVGVWRFDSIHKTPKCLRGHSRNVTALSFGNKQNPCMLCSGSEDSIFVWHAEKAFYDYNTGNVTLGTKVAKDLGKVQFLSFSESDIHICACVQDEVWIIDIQACKLVATLGGHTSLVTGARFCPHDDSTVVSIGEDRTFKVWNLQTSTVIFKSSIVSAFPFLSIAMHPDHRHFALGTSDGKLRVYDLCTHRMLHEVDVGKLATRAVQCKDGDGNKPVDRNVISSLPSWKQTPAKEDASPDEEVEPSFSILNLSYWKDSRATSVTLPGVTENETLLLSCQGSVREALQDPAILVVGLTTAVLLLDASSFDVLFCFNFHGSQAANSSGPIKCLVSVAACFAFWPSHDKIGINVLIGGMFEHITDVITIYPHFQNENTDTMTPDVSSLSIVDRRSESDVGCNEDVTVIPSVPVRQLSVLRAELIPKPTNDRKDKKAKTFKKPDKMDQPLVFHTKVQSSGYKCSPRTKMFTPQVNHSKEKTDSQVVQARNRPKDGRRIFDIEYPMYGGHPAQLQSKHKLPTSSTAINHIQFSDDGKYLACALSDKSASLLRIPFSGKLGSFVGHNGIVYSSSVSHDSKWLLTASADKTCKLWCNGMPDPLLSISNTKHNFLSEKVTPAEEKDNPVFQREITKAQFYYVDKFILLTVGGTLYLYKYHVDPVKNDLKRYLTQNRYKLVQQFTMEQAQHITTFSAVNSFYSYIVLCACSNRSVVVIDMNVGRIVRTFDEAHTRNVHSICQNEGSQFAANPPDAYDLFLTSATTDGIKLWDLRGSRCVRRYDGHQNRAQTTGLAITPCSRYIATGSEDRAAYMYDIRNSSYLCRLANHSDVVSSVSFHPKVSMLATASLDGEVRFYKDG